MAKVTFSSLKLKTNNKVNTFTFNDKVIEVKQYLTADDKNNLISAAVNRANEGTVFNPHIIDVYFHLYLVMYYTNLSFTEKQQEDLLSIYDALESNGFINEVVKNMEESEYNYLRDIIGEISQIVVHYNNSIKASIDAISQFAPNTAERISQELNNFDIDKYEQVVNIARGAGAQI